MDLDCKPKEKYCDELQKTFQKILSANKDPSLSKESSPKKQQSFNHEVIDKDLKLLKEEIFFMQYPMEKKGKNFKTTEVRTFKIEGGKLLQIDKSSSQKQLPAPSKVVFHQKYEKDNIQWSKNYTEYSFKIQLQFATRTPISVYFKEKQQGEAIFLYLIHKISKNNGYFNLLQRKFRSKVIDSFLKRFSQTRKNKEYANSEKKAYKTIQRLQDVFKQSNQVKNLIYEWQRMSYEVSEEMDVSIELFSFISELDCREGYMKLWVGNQTHEKNISCEKNSRLINDQIYESKFQKPNKFCLDKISTNTIIQFQLEVKRNSLEKVHHLWRSERMIIFDLLRSKSKSRKIIINLFSSKKKSQLSLQILNLNNLSPQTYHIKNITPVSYPIIREMYGKIQTKSLDPSIHTAHCQTYRKFLEYQSSTFLSYHCFRKLFEALSVETLIQKIYSTSPFSEYKNISHKGTFFYSSLIKKSEKSSFYDVQKLIWKHQNPQLKRFLSAFKSFDENPRINFTDPFYFICQRCIELVMNESTMKWKDQLFDATIIGRQSMAFFLVLGLLKIGSSLLLQQQKKVLSTNTLLFHYILKNNQQFSSIYHKIIRTQLNIEAFFGIHSVCLFSELFSFQLFSFVVEIFAQQNKSQQSSIHHSLIGVMLALIILVDQYKSLYMSPDHYIEFYKHFCENILPTKGIEFMKLAKKYQNMSILESKSEIFQNMKESQEKFHEQNLYSGELGEISEQLYDEFMCYHFKREADIRKIFMVIDRIQLGKPAQAICISLYQNNQKIYEHEFNGVSLDDLRHPIDFKLLRLDIITLIVNYKNKNSLLNSYTCELDPKAFPSNYYFQFVSELNPIKIQTHSQRYIAFQAYIKDSCEIQYLENSIPEKYISNLLLSEIKGKENQLQNQLLKEEIIFCNSYIKNFRMRQNNLNLLYGKLGWYGNHYLVPEERVISIYKEQGDRISEMESDDEKRLNLLKYYSRCIFGKCLLPINQLKGSQNMKFHTETQKSSMIITHQTTKNQIKEYLQYTSINNLLSYTLDNFFIPISMNFIEFYYKINKNLPLLSYLGYQTLQFYTIPTTYITINYQGKSCRVLFAEGGLELISNFSKERLYYLQKWASTNFILPEAISFLYYSKSIVLDQFLYLLKFNILEQCYQKMKKSPPNSPSKKVNHIPTTLVPKNNEIPNYPLYNLYCLLVETDANIEIQFTKASIERLERTQLFDDFAFINGKWRNVAILLKIESPNHKNYYVEQANTRKKYVVTRQELIEGVRRESPINVGYLKKEAETVKFTDKEVQQMKQCVLNEINQFLM